MLYNNVLSVPAMKNITHTLFTLLILTSMTLDAQTSLNKHDLHEKHTRVGSHGMVLFTNGKRLFASHLPLYQAPHDYQLVYEVESTHRQQLLEHLTQTNKTTHAHYVENMITLLPATFDLNTLINGQSFEIETQFYLGHFERGGKKWLKDKNFTFVRQIYKRPLTTLRTAEKPNQIEWHILDTGPDNKQLLIHPIQAAPSFDAIVFGHQCFANSLVNQSESVPDIGTLYPKIKQCQSMEVLYFEIRDFAK